MLTNISSPDLHLLRVFMAVTEAGGFSRAQLALNVSQSTISTQMADLEARLKLKLCRRGRAGFSLTDEGRAVYDAAKQLFDDCNGFVSKVNALQGEITGDLRIATADALLGHPAYRLQSVIFELRQRLPSVHIQIHVMDPLEIERLVLEQRLHAGIHTFPNHAPGLRYRQLFDEAQVLYCGRGHPMFARAAMAGAEEIAEHDYASRTYYGGSLRTGEFRPKRLTASASNMESMVAMILSGQFLGHLPAQCAEPWVQRGEMRALGVEAFTYHAKFECVVSTGTRSSRAQKILEEVIVAGTQLPDGIEEQSPHQEQQGRRVAP